MSHSHHKGPVNELSFDAEGEFLGSCSEDGTVVIASLAGAAPLLRHDLRIPVKVTHWCGVGIRGGVAKQGWVRAFSRLAKLSAGTKQCVHIYA